MPPYVSFFLRFSVLDLKPRRRMPSCTQAGEEDMPLHVQDRSAKAASTYCSGGIYGCLPTIVRRRRQRCPATTSPADLCLCVIYHDG
ncbi:hypothetical protein BRADI_4g22527v3 [Brachypodium distachyon]|uniref:Uncharacterized protein n=1 Tax=Brachypodium distachyon TaxID=15368 RepID=A0A2K2CPI8_BRADI|nr:hypothetical protein BRADI_4g22527v3 [Brachypodium distachyon]